MCACDRYTSQEAIVEKEKKDNKTKAEKNAFVVTNKEENTDHNHAPFKDRESFDDWYKSCCDD